MKFRAAFTLAAFTLAFAAGCGDAGHDGPADDGDAEGGVATAASALSVFQWSPPAHAGTSMSNDAVALAPYGGKVHMVHTSGTSSSLAHAVYDGTSWSPPVIISGQKSKNRPALAAFGPKGSTRLHMVHQGETSDDLWWSLYDGTSWTANSNTGMTSTQAPIATVYGGAIHLFGTNTKVTCTTFPGGSTSCNSTDVLWESSSDGSSWTPKREIVTAANRYIDGAAGAAVAVYNSVPVLVVRRASNDLWMYTFQNGVWSGGTKIAGQKSKSAPALAVWGGYLQMTHLGDTSNSVWWSYYDGVSWTANNAIPSTSSHWATAMAPMTSKLVQAFPMYCSGVCNQEVHFQTFQ